jgi:hypothetical protein
VKWFQARIAEYVPDKSVLGKEAQRWLRDNSKSDEVNDEMFKEFLERLMEY